MATAAQEKVDLNDSREKIIKKIKITSKKIFDEADVAYMEKNYRILKQKLQFLTQLSHTEI